MILPPPSVTPAWRRGFILLLLAVACLPLANALRVETGTYSFRNIADTRERFDQFFPAPAVSNAGTIVFAARLKTGEEGIFAAKSGWWSSLVTLADTHGDFGYFGHLPSVNEAGIVLFSAGFKRGNTCDATVPVHGGTITTVATTSGPSRMTTLGMSSINRAGQVAFFRMQDDGLQGIFVGAAHGGPLASIADNQGQFHTFGLQLSINDAGSVVFLACTKQGGWGLYRIQRPGDVPVLLLAAGTKGFVSMSNPVTNAQGTVVFRGSRSDQNEGMYKLDGTGGALTTVADHLGNGYGNFFGWAVNDAGRVAFGATTGDGRQGIYTGPDPLKDRVIGTGDALFRSQVQSAFVAGRGLNRKGEIAFTYRLVDDQSGVALAVPFRWSRWTTLLLVCSAGLFGWGLVIRMRRRGWRARRLSAPLANGSPACSLTNSPKFSTLWPMLGHVHQEAGAYSV